MSYSINSLRKLMKKATELINHYASLPAEQIKICISKGNRKIGRVMNVSLLPIKTCANASGCHRICYDVKACLQYVNVLDARVRNTVLAKYHRDEYFRRIEDAISRRRAHKFFRWHVAGDILDLDYFSRMVEIARSHPDFVFWTYTKNYAVVNEYVSTHGGSIAEAIPSNLTVMYSEWRGMQMDNPFGFPEFRVVFKDEVEPEGFYCPGNCDICKASRRGCIASETVFCREH